VQVHRNLWVGEQNAFEIKSKYVGKNVATVQSHKTLYYFETTGWWYVMTHTHAHARTHTHLMLNELFACIYWRVLRGLGTTKFRKKDVFWRGKLTTLVSLLIICSSCRFYASTFRRRDVCVRCWLLGRNMWYQIHFCHELYEWHRICI
jgi:hypothetical protein